jgi:molybdenum cofactor biosynthesis protein B
VEPESVGVNVAVLAIAEDPATADLATVDLVTDLVSAAGHLIVAREIVKDSEIAIRQKLVRWISDPDIDVVIASGGIESKTAAAALAPLVTQPLPGFRDLLRLLAYQELGAGAMLSNAEAADCNSTFVFVLPASTRAVRTAMEKLVIPQLDHRTQPQNLVMSMPRLRNAQPGKPVIPAIPPVAKKASAVPTPITNEKTAGGVGLAPKVPAVVPAQRRVAARPVARNKPAADDPPTRPIALATLQQQISLSSDASAHDVPTRPIDLAGLLPRVPPGADESLDVDDDSVLESQTLLFSPTVPEVHEAPAEVPSASALGMGTRSPVEVPPISTTVQPKPPDPPAPPKPALAAPLPLAKPQPAAPPPITQAASNDLPIGQFSYPVKRRSHKTILVAGGLVLAAAASFLAVVKLFPDHPSVAAPPQVVSMQVIVADAPPAAAPPDAKAEDSEQQEIVFEETAPTSVAAEPAAPVKPTPRIARQTPKPPPSDPAPSATPPSEPATEAKVPEPPTPPSADPTCDEVSCVLEKYARPCCQRYRPADPGFKPKSSVPDELDRSMVLAGVEKVKPGVIACGEKLPAKGIVKLSIAVAADGHVQEVSVKDTPDQALGACVVKAMQRAKFGTTVNGGTFTYPFAF